jgi:hypothetical protein
MKNSVSSRSELIDFVSTLAHEMSSSTREMSIRFRFLGRWAAGSRIVTAFTQTVKSRWIPSKPHGNCSPMHLRQQRSTSHNE